MIDIITSNTALLANNKDFSEANLTQLANFSLNTLKIIDYLYSQKDNPHDRDRDRDRSIQKMLNSQQIASKVNGLLAQSFLPFVFLSHTELKKVSDISCSVNFPDQESKKLFELVI